MSFAVREFLDEFQLLPRRDLMQRSIDGRPPASGSASADAFIAALAEHLAARHGLERPGWSIEPSRFLSGFWFASDVPGFRATAIAQSPAAFRRRGIFVSERALSRV